MTRATKAKGLPVNREPLAEFFHSFSRPWLEGAPKVLYTLSAGPSALATTELTPATRL